MKNRFDADSLSGQLMQSAHTVMHAAHHDSDYDEQKIFNSLSDDEKSELLSLLKKINSSRQ